MLTKRIQEEGLDEKLLMTVWTTLDRSIDAETGIKCHIGKHDTGRLIARIEYSGDCKHIDREGPETDKQTISGTANFIEAVLPFCFFIIRHGFYIHSLHAPGDQAGSVIFFRSLHADKRDSEWKCHFYRFHVN